jgi:CheY-like chemotaxis protein
MECPTRAGSVRVVVKDTGAGMTKEQLSMLGTDFCQFDANKLQHGGGSGLGLAIAKGIVDQHNGTITTQSDGPGMGTTFTVELPLYDIPRALRHRGDNPHRETTSTEITSMSVVHDNDDTAKDRSPCHCHRILVVEDAESSQKMLIRLLERDGHKCVGAGNGQKAVDAIAADLVASSRADDQSHVPFDTILMDFEMPVMNGRKLRYSFVFANANHLFSASCLSPSCPCPLPQPKLSNVSEKWATPRFVSA